MNENNNMPIEEKVKLFHQWLKDTSLAYENEGDEDSAYFVKTITSMFEHTFNL